MATIHNTGSSKLWDISGRLFILFNRMRVVAHFGLMNVTDIVPFELRNVKGETHLDYGLY